MGYQMRMYLPFQHSILSQHPLEPFPHHLMIRGHTSERKKCQGQVGMFLRDTQLILKSTSHKTAKH